MRIIIPRHFLYLLYLCPCLDVGLFMPYLYDQFFNFIFILQAYLTYFAYFIEYVPSFFDDNMDEECE